MKQIDVKGKKVLVIGMGKSGLSALKLLSEQGAIVDCYDGKLEPQFEEEARTLIHKSFFGVDPVLLDYSLAVIAPGVPLTIDLVKRLRIEGVKLIGEVELAYLCAEGTFIGITGTNGKTTTTTWTWDCFKRAGKKAYLAGNVGIALCDVVRDFDEKDSIYVTELSSFQLETIDRFKVKSALILNVTPDHLQRYGTMENYAREKFRIAENMENPSEFVLNYDDEILKSHLKDYGRARLLSQETENADIYVKNGKIYAKKGSFSSLPSDGDIEIIDVKEVFLKGAHNIQNACGMVALALLNGIDLRFIRESLREFRGVAHRNEFVLTAGGIVFYNDSKATNPEASMPAIRAMDRPYVLIAGGMDKRSDYALWIAEFKNMKKLILFGETKYDIAEAMNNAGREDYEIVDNLDQAFERAVAIAAKGDAVLLSPACASWDMYPSFEVRGEHFKTLCHKWEQNHD